MAALCTLLLLPTNVSIAVRWWPLIEANLYINSGRWYLSHVPSTFATVNTHANVFIVFLPGSSSKEWCQIVSANCDFEGEPGLIVPMFTGLSGNTWETAKRAHKSHNDVRRLFVLLTELGLRKVP